MVKKDPGQRKAKAFIPEKGALFFTTHSEQDAGCGLDVIKRQIVKNSYFFWVLIKRQMVKHNYCFMVRKMVNAGWKVCCGFFLSSSKRHRIYHYSSPF